MIKAGNDASAITFLQVAIGWLKVAEAGGTDVGLLISLLEQVILALSDKGESSLFAAHVTNLNDTGSGSCDGISTSCTVITGYAGGGTLRPSEVPVAAAVWLFGSGMLGLVGIARRKKAA